MEVCLQALLSIFKIFLFVICVGVSSVEARNKLSNRVYERVEPYQLPVDHPIKAKLEDIFSRSRAIVNEQTLIDAGFINPKARKWTHVVVTSHPELPGYIIKTYLDSQRYFKQIKEYEHWIARIEGARAIQNMLDNKGWNAFFKVPKKWIYTLPKEPAAPQGLQIKHFILVEEDMQILNKTDNIKAWKGDGITKEKLQMLYQIIEELGLNDCPKISNAPLSQDGRIAFIDTESSQEWPIHYERLTDNLAESLQEYWKELTGAPK